MAIRCRPMSTKEVADGHAKVVDINCEQGTVQLQKTDSPSTEVKIYTFDSVYDWNVTQEEIYADIFHPLVHSVLEGFNGTIFAYGQTGTGKTYTMEGSADDPGVIPRSFTDIFNHIARSSHKQFLVRSSYLGSIDILSLAFLLINVLSF